MKHKAPLMIASAVLSFVMPNFADAMVTHTGKTVSLLEIAISGCYFFQLSDVGEADPVAPNSPWFAISTTQANAKEMYALLVIARTNGTSINRVLTNGQTACGHAQVLTIDF